MLGEWVICTPDRARRPFQEQDHECPFCPGGEETLGDWDVLTIDNKFAALRPSDIPLDLDSDIIIGAPAHGYCKLIIESRQHDEQIEDMSIDHLQKVFIEYARVFKELDQKQGIEYVYQFENRGKSIGVSLNHPHAQVYALPFVPPRIQKEAQQFVSYRERFGDCLICENIENEFKSRERVVHESDNFVTLVPYGARLPYEVHVYPKQHVGTLEELLGDISEFSQVIQDVIKRYAVVFEEIAYVMAFHARPSGSKYQDWHFHVEFYPPWRDSKRLKFLAGVETGIWTFTNDSSPEEKAKELREAL
jgi:UDPglucose--hexose-1-phosphate uridylyltransferase